jgi:hypothetical protein
MRTRWSIASLLAVAACQPLHGGPAEQLHMIPTKPMPKGATTVETVAYVEDCTVNFAYVPVSPGWHPQPARAVQLVADGDAVHRPAVANGDSVERDDKRVFDMLYALEKYREALEANPYDAEATLKLALQYDALRRKGCALAMLHRLTALTINPRFITAANAQIQTVGDNPSWFKGYRNEALVAVGLPPQRSRTIP